ncbi:type II toxin-antitoxin system RelE/ParE family toxin [Pedobacter cryophilus]|uniref:Type II toxin-antitoxin system RelE/ParE family toxin n=1 Tax=Pedobacter cryophilus TaxID=2571271 RepID=A0A4U1C8Q2_9SPHI|nr:type II toxin-antitoxin system RelE/ParE family toxin [Pedobacter cryophilus]TKC00807.1 type II toxin-antitoxin system RelE/ParE family toxin [Pedobacter cryophilus]
MVRKVIWSLRAQQERKHILTYWQTRTKSNIYSKKLNQLFIEAINIISDFPQIGKLTDDQNARIKIVKDYFIIYEYFETQILILSIFDSRQDPAKIDFI